ncbi:MAG: polysaccharide deacetylase family protein [Gemmatimonadales bacterium]
MATIRDSLKNAYYSVVSAVHRRPVALGEAPPMVTFTFDDFPRSAYDAAGATLRAFGGHGTYYAAAGWMDGGPPSSDRYRTADLPALLLDGHELGTHTYSHVSCRSLSTAAYAAEIARGHEALQQVVGDRASAHFAFPFGAVTPAVKKVAARQCRSSRVTIGGCNGPVADLNFLRANRLYSDSVPFPRIQALIASAARPGRWLIFYTHDVRERPSPFGCTPQYFEDTVRCAVGAGMRVLTVGEALAAIGAAPPASPASPAPVATV